MSQSTLENLLERVLEVTTVGQRRLAAFILVCIVIAVVRNAFTGTAPGGPAVHTASIAGSAETDIPPAPAPSVAVIKNHGSIRVAVHDPLYERFDTPGTPVYKNLQIAEDFAASLDRPIDIVKTESRESALQLLNEQSVDLVFSNHIEPSVFPFPGLKSVALQEVQLLVVGIQGPSAAPRGLADLQNKSVAVSRESGVAEIMQRYVARWPAIQLIETQERSTPELLDMVMSTQVQYAVVQSNEFLLLQHFFPELISKYELTGTFPVGWVVSMQDPLFVTQLEQFIRDYKASGQMQQLASANSGHLLDFNYSEAKLFLDRVSTKLPAYEKTFRTAAEQFDIDWRLLAAIAHQESHWDPLAESPTGVRGMMMLTRETAQEMGVEDRLDPYQSILGGARYFRRQYDLLPDETPPADRVWLALASYNLGRLHILRAQDRAKVAGNDPLEWNQLRQHLLDAGESTGTTTDALSGDAAIVDAGRRREAVKYVSRVRRYHDMLAWISRQSPSTPMNPQYP